MNLGKVSLCVISLLLLLIGKTQAQSITIQVNGSNAVANNYSCINESVQFSIDTTGFVPDSFYWTFQGGVPANDTIFDPTSLFNTADTFEITVSASDSVQTLFDTIQLIVRNLPTVTYNEVTDTVCLNAVPFALAGGSPGGGGYSGVGVSNNNLDPTPGGTGYQVLTYTYTDSYGCSNSANDSLYVQSIPSYSVVNTGGTWTTYQGDSVYRKCQNVPNWTMSYIFTSVNNTTTYSIDHGDGSPLVTGSPPLPPFINHTYSQQGFINPIISLTAPNGCVLNDTLRYYFGTNPAGGISSPGSNVYCLTPQNPTITDTFTISNLVNSNPPGTQYTIEVNDGTPPTVFTTPPSSLQYIHTFSTHSCNPTPPGPYPNSFNISLTIENPCDATLSQVTPVKVSEAAIPDLSTDTIACLNEVVTITDQSNYGTSITGSGNNIACTTGGNLIWTLTPNTYNLLSGPLSMGFTTNNLQDINSWFSGSSAIDVQFTQTGTYTLTQYVSNITGCGVDSMVQTICVQEEPDTSILHFENLNGGSMCTELPVRLSELGSDSSLCEPYEYTWNFTPSGPVAIDSGATDTKEILVSFTEADTFDIQLVKKNACDSIVIDTTIYVLGRPRINFDPDTFYCDSIQVAFDTTIGHTYSINDSLDYNYTFDWSVNQASGWNFINSAASDSAPIINFNQSAIYDVQFVVNNTCGADTVIQSIEIFDSPVLNNFVSDTLCYNSSDTIDPVITLGSEPFVYTWNYDTNTTNDTLITIGPLDSLLHIDLLIVDSVGCSTQDSIVRDVYPELFISSSSDTSVCLSDSVLIGTNPTGGVPGFQYSWNPTGGLSNSTLDSIYVYGSSSVGTYFVTATDSAGCTISDSVNINYLALPVADAGVDQLVCELDSIQIGAAGITGFQYSWNSNPSQTIDSLSNPWVSPFDTTNYFLMVTDTNNCDQYDTVEIGLYPPSEAGFTFLPDSGCAPLSVQLTDTSNNAVSLEWFVNNQLVSTASNPTVTLTNTSHTADSVYTILLISTSSDGCIDSLEQQIIVHPIPDAQFSVVQDVCSGDTATVLNNSNVTNGSFSWSATNGNISIIGGNTATPQFHHPEFATGSDSTFTFEAIVTSAFGCADTHTVDIVFYSLPQVNFSLPSSACGPATVTAINNSTGVNLSHLWSSTGGVITVPSSINPTLQFAAVAQDSIIETVELVTTDSRGCVNQDSTNISIYAQPNAAFTFAPDSICSPALFNFDATNSTSNVTGNNNLIYLWTFDNGNTFNGVTATNTYNNTGTVDSLYSNQLLVTNDLGCSDTASQDVLVYPNAVAEINSLSSADCAPFSFTNAEIAAVPYPNTNATYTWRVIDVNTLQVLNTFNGINSLSYTLPNAFDSVYVELITTSTNGCDNDTDQVIVTALQGPDATFNLPQTSICTPATFNPTYGGTLAGISLDWLIDSVSQGINSSTPTFTFANNSNTQDSTLYISLVATAGSGCTDTSSQLVTIWPQPISDFSTPDTVCPLTSFTPTNNSVGTNLSFNWTSTYNWINLLNPTANAPIVDIGDNQSGADSTAVIDLIITDANGCQDTSSSSVVIPDRPVASFTTPSSSCGPVTLNPTDNSSNAIQYDWSINPIVTNSNTHSASPTFNLPISLNDSVVYTIELITQEGFGCSDTSSSTYTVYPKPTASFTAIPNAGCDPLAVNFDGSVSGSNQTGAPNLIYNWTFGNGALATTVNPLSTFTNSGVTDSTYSNELIVTNDFGCSDTVNQNITVFPNAEALISTASVADCAPFTIDTSTATATDYPIANASYTWRVLDYSTGQVLNTFNGINALNYTITLPTDSIYLELIAQSPNGCENDTDQVLMYSLEDPDATFSLASSAVCSPAAFTPTYGGSISGLTVDWMIDGSIQSVSGASPTFTFSNSSATADSLIEISLALTAGSGCTDTTSQQVIIWPKPNASFVLIDSICPNSNAVPSNTSIGNNLQASWSANLSSVNFSNSLATNPIISFDENQSGSDSTTAIEMIVTDQNGCADTANQDVVIVDRPNAQITLPAPACSPVALLPSSSTTANVYNWSITPSVISSGVNTNSPNFTLPTSINDSVDYTVELIATEAFGCADTAQSIYTVYPVPTADYNVSSNVGCTPFSVDFNASISSSNQTGFPNLTYNWNFGNGNSSAVNNPDEVFSNTGVVDSIYTNELIINNDFGCADTVIDSITVYPNARAEFVVNNPTDCAPFVIDNSNVVATSYPNANNTYTWRVINFSTQQVLATFNGINSLNYTLPLPNDSVTIELITSSLNGCEDDTASALIYTLEDPDASFVVPSDSLCSPASFGPQYNLPTAGLTLEWTLDEIIQPTSSTNPSFSFINSSQTADSTIQLGLIVTAGFGCADTTEQTITIWPKPISAFSAMDTICPLNSFTPTNSSVGNGLTYQWSSSLPLVGTANNALQTPTFNVGNNQSGVDSTITLELIVVNDKGCSDTTSQVVTIPQRTIANFSLPASNCSPFTLNPADLSSNVSVYNWSINPATVSTGVNSSTPSFDLPTSTNDSVDYTITLITEELYGCSDTSVQDFTVYPVPTASFTTLPGIGCTPLSVVLDGTGSSANQTGIPNLSYSWNFGNGLVSSQNTDTTIFTNSGVIDSTYQNQLIVTNIFGCSDTVIDSVTVYPSARSEIIVAENSNCAPYSVDTSSLSAVVYPNTNATYTWIVLDDDTSTVLNTYTGINGLNHNIANANDTVFIQLVTISLNGCTSDTTQELVYSLPDPDATFSLNATATCSPATFDAGIISSPTGLTLSWYLDGSNQGISSANTSFNFTNSSHTADSLITISMLAVAGTGCSDSTAQQVTVWPKPLSNFGVIDTLCPLNTFAPTDSSIGNSLDYQWSSSLSIANTGNDTISNPVYDVGNNQSGVDSTLTLELIVTDSNNCADTSNALVVVPDRTIADFSLPQDSCSPAVLSPNDLSSYVLNYSWSIAPSVASTGVSTSGPTFNLPTSTNDSVVYSITLETTENFGCADTSIQEYTVYPVPTANFTTLPDTGCDALLVNFDASASTSNQAGFPALQYHWIYGNGLTDTTELSTSTFTNTGVVDSSYQNELIVTNTFGCSDTILDSVLVFPHSRAEFSVAVDTGCAPFTVDNSNIIATAYPNANATYTWRVLNAATGNLITTFNGISNLIYTIPLPDDSVIVELVTTSMHSCNNDTASVTLYSLPDPDPSFTAVPISGCTPLESVLSSQNVNSVGYQWFINGVSFSTNAIDSSIFINNSNLVDSLHTVELVATINSSGCADTSSQTITVHPQPNAQFSASTTCQGDTTTFTDNSVTGTYPLVDWSWDFGDNDSSIIQNPTHLYDTVGPFNVQLIIENAAGCLDTIIDTITIRDYPVAHFGIPSSCGLDTVCLGVSNAISDSSSTVTYSGNINTWNWDIDYNTTIDYTGQTTNHTFNTTGFTDVALEVVTQYGCADTAVRTFFVNEPPQAILSISDDTLCGPASFSVTNTSTGLVEDYLWEVYGIDANGNQSVIYSDSNFLPSSLPVLISNPWIDTTYYVSLTTTNCCGFTVATDSIVIEPIPTVDFVIAPDSGCSPLGVNFQFNNYVSPTTDYLYVEFGDGSTDTVFPQVINPTLILWPQITHVFTNTGTIDSTYTITVTGYNNCGDSSATADVVVEPNIVQAFFTTSSVIECEGNSISFSNQSSGYTNSDWCFDYDTNNGSCGGLASNQISPNFVFPNPGLYNVALFVDNGCSYDTMVQTIEIQERPIADFSFTDSTCSNISTAFTNLSSTNVGFISSYQWDFGDSTSSSLIDPSHLYDSSGVFTACLQVEGTNGCRDTLCQDITILALPDIDFSVNNACLNYQPVQFVNNSTISGSTITGTSWSFGDGNGTNVFSPDHSYTADSTYQVTLIHTAATGCSDTATNTVIIYPVPTADFEINLASADSCSVPQTYVFTNNSAGAVAYTWDFDTLLASSATSTLTNPNHTYTQAGVYGISLTVENQFGCFDTHADSQIVSSGVTAAFDMGPLEGCAPLVVNYIDLSTDNDSIDPIQSWTWNHGTAGTITSLEDTSYIFEDLGNYTSQLVIQSLRGCTDTITQGGIIVHPTPEADFDFELIHSTAIQFDNTSITYQPDIQYFWDFEGGGSSFEESPQHQYPINIMSFDSIVNCLEVVNDLGCADTICRSAYLPPYILVVPNAFAPEMTNVGEDNIFLPKGNALIEYRLRIFDKWGNKIFETSSLGPNGVPNEPWNGTYDGKLLEMGTYIWRIEAKFDDGADWNGNLNSNGSVQKYGTVTLIR